MWFRQLQIFQLPHQLEITVGTLTEKLSLLSFTPALPSMASSFGFVPVIDEMGAPWVRFFNNCYIFCMKIEEKILPKTVIRQHTEEAITEIEHSEDRKLSQREKISLKENIELTLLARAFSKTARVYAYFDVENKRLILNTTQKRYTECFLNLIKKILNDEVHNFSIKKISPILTSWLQQASMPKSLSILESCLFRNKEDESRVVRCQHANLFSESMQKLIKEGYEVKQINLLYEDALQFVLWDDFTLRSIRYEDKLLMEAKSHEAETKLQLFDGDFLLMSSVLNQLLKELAPLFLEIKEQEKIAA